MAAMIPTFIDFLDIPTVTNSFVTTRDMTKTAIPQMLYLTNDIKKDIIIQESEKTPGNIKDNKVCNLPLINWRILIKKPELPIKYHYYFLKDSNGKIQILITPEIERKNYLISKNLIAESKYKFKLHHVIKKTARKLLSFLYKGTAHGRTT
ncbi:hypothetical protein [Xenorhabdus sp. PB30.3]|uniref:hypothetical protein n=1 Tax=Xenorhabdus sp. PB30.3 TaxID=2788941 RepID=UPI001E59862B|nr:hypothetical protein [Xenorhabdus sp. PB30.3]MCC8380785.1 hypothetical protein [Xenorhabdus sp. PB30.3]